MMSFIAVLRLSCSFFSIYVCDLVQQMCITKKKGFMTEYGNGTGVEREQEQEHHNILFNLWLKG